MNCPAPDNFWPFETLTITRIRDDRGDPTEWCMIEGLRQGGARERRARYQALFDQAELHLKSEHGKSFSDPHDAQEFEHAIMRAAVALLMD